MVTMIMLVTYNHDTISNYDDLFNMAETFIKLALGDITSNYCSKGHHCVVGSAKVSIEGGQEG